MADANRYGTNPTWSDAAPRRIRRPSVASGSVIAVGMIGLAVALGAATAINPALGAALVAVLGMIWSLSMGRRIVPVFHGTLIVVCIGLAFFGRGFAYIGVRPIYVSELAFVLAVVTVLVSLPGARWRPIHIAMALFMGWGLVRTIPYVGTYGIDALRDGVIFGYAVFAFAVSMSVGKSHIVRLLSLYRRWFPLFLLWVPIAAITAAFLTDKLPLVPGSIVPIVVFKAGDTGVHLGAFGALMLLGLGGPGAGVFRDWVTWSLWFVALAMSSIISRGGMVATSMMAASLLFARSERPLGLVDPRRRLPVPRRGAREPAGRHRTWPHPLRRTGRQQRREHLRVQSGPAGARDHQGVATGLVAEDRRIHGRRAVLLDRQGVRRQPRRR